MNKRTKQTEYLARMTARNVLCWQLSTINHLLQTTADLSGVESGERRGESLSADVFMRRSEGEGTSPVSGGQAWYLTNYIWYLTRICGENTNILNAMQPAQWKDIFTIVPDVMLDDWQLKCLILQDRNLHDDTVTQCQADAGISVQRRDFYILGNSVNSGGWWRHGSSFLDNSVRGGFVGEWRAQPYHWADESCGPSCESLRCITTKNSTSPAIFCRKNLRKYNFYLNR